MIGIARISRPWALVVLLRLPTGTRPILSNGCYLGDSACVFELRISGSALRNGTTPCRTVMPRSIAPR